MKRAMILAALAAGAMTAVLAPRRALAAAATMPAAPVGVLRPVAYNSDAVVDGGALFDCANEGFAKPAAGSGTVNPNAMVCTPKYRDFTFKAAVDAKDASSTALDCIRFDFSGAGKFADATPIPMKYLVNQPGGDGKERYLHYAFGPAEVNIVRDGKTIPARVRGEYTERGAVRWIGVKIGTALEGTCQFGDNARWMVIIDGNGNLVCGDAPGAKLIDGKLVIKPEDEANTLRVSNGTVSGDTMLVDMAEPGAARPRRVEQLCGQPMFVDGKWYQISVSPDHTKVSAKSVDLPTGRFKTEHSSWSTRLISDNGTFVSIGIAQPDGPAVPAGKYAIMNFHEYIRGDGGNGSIFCHIRDVIDGHPYMIEIKPGETTMVKVGSPLTTELTAEQKDRNVTFTLTLKDAAGGVVDLMQTARKDGLATDPDLEIQNAAGKTVFTGKIPLTGHMTYVLAWPLPQGVSGELTATLKNVTGPCPIEAKPTKFTVR